MTQPTTDTSREAVERTCNQTDMGHLSDQLPTDVCRALLAERDALRNQLAAARNGALEEAKAECEAQRVKCNDNGQFEAAAFCKNLLVYIDALKSTTPASREVTVQEAAQKAMTLMLEGVRKAALDTELGHSIIDDVFYPSIDGYIAQALAQEGQSDE